MKKITFIFLFTILQLNAQQQPVYLKFYDSNSLFNNFNNGSNCHIYNTTSPLLFPSSFLYQIWRRDRITPAIIEGTKCVKVSIKHGENDENCNNNHDGDEDFSRAEIVFNRLSNYGIGWYKLRFYIPYDFKISSNNSIEHNIFQIHYDGNTEFNWSKVSPLPPFLIEFKHQESNNSIAKLQFKYGLEFRVKPQYVTGSYTNCIDCSLGSNGRADLTHQFYGCGNHTHKQIQNYYVNYGWNEIVFEIKWSDSNDGYMNIYINTNGEYNNASLHFEGPNVYNKNMFPLIHNTYYWYLRLYYPNMLVDDEYLNTDILFHNIMKFGHYMYGSDVDSNIYFDYFLADVDNDNFNSFNTYVLNDGIINANQDILCKPVSNADSYVFYFAADGIGQYIGSNSPRLSLERLFSILNIDYFKQYHVAVRAKFNDGFLTKYGNDKIIEFRPETTLVNYQCNHSIYARDILRIHKVPHADGYVLYFREINNPSNDFYSGVDQTGNISIIRLFQRHPNQLFINVDYKIAVRANFENSNYQGDYGIPCTIRFTNSTRNNESVRIYPNPFKNIVNIIVNIKQESKLKVIIYNQRGNQIKVLFDDIAKEGILKTNWNISDHIDNKLDSKIYYCKVYINNRVITKKIINNK